MAIYSTKCSLAQCSDVTCLFIAGNTWILRWACKQGHNSLNPLFCYAEFFICFEGRIDLPHEPPVDFHSYVYIYDNRLYANMKMYSKYNTSA